MRKVFLILVFALSIFSCGVDPCDFDCSEGSIRMRVNILDKDSGENIFEIGSFARKELMITSEGDPVDFVWHEIKNQVILGSFKETDTLSFHFQLRDIDFDLDFTVVEIEEKCCSNLHFEDESVSDGEIEERQSGVYQIKIKTE